MSSLSEKLSNPRNARTALWGGIVFSLLFTAMIYLAGDRLNTIHLLPDQGA
jgi:hypothetical protein